MRLKHRDGTVIEKQDGQDRLVACLYEHVLGRLVLKLLTVKIVSQMAGAFLSTKASRCLIQPFISSSQIDMSQFEETEYQSYNEFFSRKIKPEARFVDMNPDHFISPCDSKLSVFPVTQEGRFTIKHTEYTLESLLKDKDLASQYLGGQVMIFRLSVDDYHRYCFPVDAFKQKQIVLPGKLHTVNPIANDVIPVYKENSREYCILRTKTFGNLIMMEIGALLVGKIVNHDVSHEVRRAQEKGYFQFGGSTVVLVSAKNRVVLDEDIRNNSKEGYETVVRYGEKIGVRGE